MGKRSERRVVHHERGQSGCMSGFIGIFDFRQGRSPRKLLSNKRHGSSRHAAGTSHEKSRLKSLNNSDKNLQGSDANADSLSDSDETEILKVGVSKTSVKKLIEEDMSNEQQIEKQIPNAMEKIRPDPDNKGVVGRNPRQTKKPFKISSDICVQDSKDSAIPGSQEYLSSARKVSHLDITSLMEEFCSEVQRRQELHLHDECGRDSCGVEKCMKHNHLDELDMHLVKKHSVLHEELREAAEAFLNQKLVDTKKLTQDGEIPQSKEMPDALEILSSNKELLSKLLKDSNSLLVKHIRDLQDAPSELLKESGNSRQGEELLCRKEVQKHNIHNFFRKKDKGEKRNSSKKVDDPQVSNRIVVLKPKTTGIRNSVTADSPSSSSQSQFSLAEIKRKFKNTMGENRKDRHSSFMDGILHRIPNKHHDSGNTGKMDPGRKTEPTNNSERDDKIEKPTPCFPGSPHEVASTSAHESNIYVEAKKHLEEILSGGNEDRGFPYPQSPKTLGRILSLPDYALSPFGSSRSDGEHGFVTAQMRFSPSDSFRISNENIWRFRPENNASRPSSPRRSLHIEPDAADGDDSDIKCQEFDSNPEGDVEIMEETGVASLEEDNFSDVPSKSSNDAPIESSQDDQTPSSSPSCSLASTSLLLQKVETPENVMDPPERPSPISVLEPFFDDINSPTSTTPQAELHFHEDDDEDRSTVVVTTSDSHIYQIPPCMDDKTHPFDYVTAVLQAANICWAELLGKYHCPELLLNQSLFDQVELIPSQHCGDKELLFDCMNEVLGELYGRYFGSSTWVAFVSPDTRPAPLGECLVREVWEGINWNLLPPLLPRTLDQIIGKDMERARTWMDLRSDVEVIGNEMVNIILEELMEDTLFDLSSCVSVSY